MILTYSVHFNNWKWPENVDLKFQTFDGMQAKRVCRGGDVPALSLSLSLPPSLFTIKGK